MSNISIRDLSLSYENVKVLESLNLEIDKGEFIVLLGPSGCGKSTLLNCIAGLLEISDGQIFIGDNNVTWQEPKDRGIGMVFQSYALYPQMTVKGNLSFGLKNAKLAKVEIEKKVAWAASLLQLEELLERKPVALSGGQRQRVAIGRALVRDAQVFLFDEPLSNLDAKLRAELRVEIKRLHQKLEHNTMVYVTHDQIEALTLADRIAVMRSGVIQQLADPITIYNKPENLYVAGFIGSPSMNMIDGTIEIDASGPSFKFGSNTVSLANYKVEEELTASQAVLGLRPEHISLNDTTEKHTVIGDGEVEILEPMGSDTLVWIKIGDMSLSCRVDGTSTFNLGEKVEISADLLVSSLFNKKSEQRI